MKTTQVPINSWLVYKEYTYTHTHTHTNNRILFSRKYQISFAVIWLDLYYMKEVRQRQILYESDYMGNLKNNTNESLCKTKTGS